VTGTDPVVWLRTTLDAAVSRADRWHDVECDVHTTSLGDAVVLQCATLCDCGGPAAVLRRIAADRKLLDDLLAEKHHVCIDSWYTCPAATEERDGGTYAETTGGGSCDCGRDERVQRRVRLLAEGWGWEETT
jgi:hypothetical protein